MRTLRIIASLFLLGVITALVSCNHKPTVYSVSLVSNVGSVTPGLETQLTAGVEADAGVVTTIDWSVSDTAVALVSPSGKLSVKNNAPVGKEFSVTATSTANPKATVSISFVVSKPLQ